MNFRSKRYLAAANGLNQLSLRDCLSCQIVPRIRDFAEIALERREKCERETIARKAADAEAETPVKYSRLFYKSHSGRKDGWTTGGGCL